MNSLQPYRGEAKQGGNDTGLLTGYFEPQLPARRVADADFAVPLLDAQQRPLLYLQDPLDAVLLQVQGSGRVLLREPNGREHWRRVAWAGHNQQPFRSLARWLVEQGGLREGQAGWSAVKAWALQNPERLPELLAANPRTIYFREEALPDPTQSARAAPRACRSRRAARSPSTRAPCPTAPCSGWTARSRCRPNRCNAWCWPRTPAAPSPARCVPTSSGAGRPTPWPRPAARARRCAGGRCGRSRPPRGWPDEALA